MSLLYKFQQLRLSQSPKQNPVTRFRQSLIFVQIYITRATILHVRGYITILSELSTISRPQWPRGLRRRSAVPRLLRFRFESHRGHGCLSGVSVVCCQVGVSAMGWEYDRLLCVVLCDLETSSMRWRWPTSGLLRHKKKVVFLLWKIR